MNYQLHPDQIERTWSDHHIREWCEYQQILGKEAEERKKQMDL